VLNSIFELQIQTVIQLDMRDTEKETSQWYVLSHGSKECMTTATPKPPALVLTTDETQVGSYLQDEVLQTPVTPVSIEALASLHNLIKQDAHTLNGTSVQRL
jgi:hypothetical protein